MVDVGAKAVTRRVAVATGKITMKPATFRLVVAGRAKKGDVLGVNRRKALDDHVCVDELCDAERSHKESRRGR